MFIALLKKEIIDSLQGIKYYIVCVLILSLGTSAIFYGVINYDTTLKSYEASRAVNQRKLKNQKNYYDLGHEGYVIIKKPEKLSLFVTGINKVMSNAGEIYVDKAINMKQIYMANGIMASQASNIINMELNTIVKVIFSLIALFFAFDAIVEEKRSGTLRLIMANSVPRDIVLFAKIIGRYLSLMIPFFVSCMLGFLILLISSNISLNFEDLIRVALLIFIYMLYMFFWFMIGLFVSSITGSISSSMFTSFALWIVFMVVIPHTIDVVAQKICPIPNTYEIDFQIEALLKENRKEMYSKYTQWRNRQEKEPSITEVRKILEEMEEAANKKSGEQIAKIEGERLISVKRKAQVTRILSCISPAVSVDYAAMTITRTGIENHERFYSSLLKYKLDFTTWLHGKRAEQLEKGNDILNNLDLEDIPKYEYKTIKLKESMSQCLMNIASILLLTIGTFAATYFTFLRYDVR